jgi:hypothetical protein
MSDGSGVDREAVRPAQIQYQLLTAQLAIGDEWEGPEDAPEGVVEGLEHIQTAANLFNESSLSDARPRGPATLQAEAEGYVEWAATALRRARETGMIDAEALAATEEAIEATERALVAQRRGVE